MKMIKKTAVYSLISASLVLAGAPAPVHADVGGDLTPDKPLVDQELVNQIEQKIVELSNKSEKDVQASGMSVPDFKPAYDDLQKALTDALTGYVAALSQIDDSLSTELAHLKALEAQAQGDSSGLFKQLVDDEFKRVFPTLNAQLNATYSAALSTLYTLPSTETVKVRDYYNNSYDQSIRVSREIPVEWKINDNNSYSLRIQTGEIAPDGDERGGSLFTRSDFDTHFFGNGLTDEGRQESADFLHQNFQYKYLFANCTTGACVLKLKDSIAQAVALADALNVGISFANVPSQTVIKKADLAIDSPVARDGSCGAWGQSDDNGCRQHRSRFAHAGGRSCEARGRPGDGLRKSGERNARSSRLDVHAVQARDQTAGKLSHRSDPECAGNNRWLLRIHAACGGIFKLKHGVKQ
jgi:hypothetical protein